MKTNRFYVDIHALQVVPPSCVNRDDTGSPKTAVYGGCTRARVSSQAWKRAVRQEFRNMFDEEKLGKRTKMIPALLAQKIHEMDDSKNADKLALEALKQAGIKVKEKESALDALFFISSAQVNELARLAVEGCQEAAAYKNVLKEGPSVDLALFGRMVASDPSMNYDACAQVAHAISTHAVHTEYDYFTAVDDCSSEDNSGAGHLGTVEFNSSTLYRYATVNVAELAKLLGDETPEVLCAFIEAFIRTMPTGRQNTFANRTLPDYIYVTVRRDQPVNMAGAFEAPVAAGKDGYMQNSVKRLCEYSARVHKSVAGSPDAEFIVSALPDAPEDACSLAEMLKNVQNMTSEKLKEFGVM